MDIVGRGLNLCPSLLGVKVLMMLASKLTLPRQRYFIFLLQSSANNCGRLKYFGNKLSWLALTTIIVSFWWITFEIIFFYQEQTTKPHTRCTVIMKNLWYLLLAMLNMWFTSPLPKTVGKLQLSYEFVINLTFDLLTEVLFLLNIGFAFIWLWLLTFFSLLKNSPLNPFSGR